MAGPKCKVHHSISKLHQHPAKLGEEGVRVGHLVRPDGSPHQFLDALVQLVEGDLQRPHPLAQLVDALLHAHPRDGATHGERRLAHGAPLGAGEAAHVTLTRTPISVGHRLLRWPLRADLRHYFSKYATTRALELFDGAALEAGFVRYVPEPSDRWRDLSITPLLIP